MFKVCDFTSRFKVISSQGHFLRKIKIPQSKNHVTEILLKVALNTITSISNRKSGIIDREIYMYRICSVV
jgi:hypothetical protein